MDASSRIELDNLEIRSNLSLLLSVAKTIIYISVMLRVFSIFIINFIAIIRLVSQ